MRGRGREGDCERYKVEEKLNDREVTGEEEKRGRGRVTAFFSLLPCSYPSHTESPYFPLLPQPPCLGRQGGGSDCGRGARVSRAKNMAFLFGL